MPIIPTKGNLMAAKRSIDLAHLGYELMDRKRNILIREMMSLIDRADLLQSQIDEKFTAAYSALQMANITLGTCSDIAKGVPIDNTLAIKSRSIMGVEIPSVRCAKLIPTANYSFSDTNSMLDETSHRFYEVKQLITDLAEVENSVYRLAEAIKKTQKRANALKNITIPNLETTIKFITDALEEKDREDFVRLKVIKAQKAKTI